MKVIAEQKSIIGDVKYEDDIKMENILLEFIDTPLIVI